MTMRVLMLVLALSLVALPGCMELIQLPFTAAKALLDVLFFWADASGVVAPDGPLPLADALDHAVASGPASPVWLVPAGSALPEEALSPPSPGAIPVYIPVTATDGEQIRAARSRPTLDLREVSPPPR